MIQRLRRRRCQRLGHDWFPRLEASQFVPHEEICFRCGAKVTVWPYGTCLCGHTFMYHPNQGPCTECQCPIWQ